MSILSTLKTLSTQALQNKERELRTLYNTAQSDIKSQIEEERLSSKKSLKESISEEEEIKAISTLIKRLNKTFNKTPSDDLKEYIDLLSQFAPKLLTKEEIYNILVSNNLNSMKEVMPYLNKNYPGRIDGNLVRLTLEELKR